MESYLNIDRANVPTCTKLTTQMMIVHQNILSMIMLKKCQVLLWKCKISHGNQKYARPEIYVVTYELVHYSNTKFSSKNGQLNYSKNAKK